MNPFPVEIPRSQSLTAHGASVIQRGFDTHTAESRRITRRARVRFERGDWHGMQQDARERLALYRRVLDPVVTEVATLLEDRVKETAVWARMRDAYSAMTAGYPNVELAETFFNSVTRRIFTTVGVNPAIEYVDFEFERVPLEGGDRIYRSYQKSGTTEATVRAILTDYRFAVPYPDLDGDARLIAQRIEQGWAQNVAPVPFEAIEVLEPVFYRRKGAYLVGRVRGGARVMPLIVALRNDETGIVIDAVLLTEADVSIVFSFTRSYFHVDVTSPAGVIQFLKSIMPQKPVAELYIALGHNKHGKTEFYRALRRHLARTEDKFVVAPGAPGMVMVVFTLPSYDVVFKVIRDHFVYPKRTTRDSVRRRYQLVFEHDRAGRLVDAQEFEYLAFARRRFSPDLLNELLTSAPQTVTVEGDHVVIRHLYTERRVQPLNLYLREADPAGVERAVLDYGQAIRDLARTNIFPGDLLLKNFGVTRHGRVIFYDYDELCLLEECNFREMPPPRYPEDEVAAEPWFYVGPNDIFPEELIRFLELKGPARELFLRHHSCLLEAGFWRDLQARHGAGEVMDVYPYSAERRLHGE